MTVLGSDSWSILTAEEDSRYALGDPAAPVLLLNAADSFGCLWWAAEPPEWAGPTTTLPVDRRQDGDGGYAGEPTFEPLTLTVTGTVAAPSGAALRAAHRRLLGAVLGARPDYQRYTHLDDDPAKGLWVLPIGTPKWSTVDPRAADFSFQLLAEDPIKTGAAATWPASGAVRLPPSGGEGGYPMGAAGAVMPWTAAGGALAQTVASVPNLGDEAAHAVYTVTGPVPQPRIVLASGGYNQLTADLGALDRWVLDTAAGTSTVNGVNRYDAWGAGSVFPLIPRGGTELRLRSLTGGTDQAAALTCLTAPSWK